MVLIYFDAQIVLDLDSRSHVKLVPIPCELSLQLFTLLLLISDITRSSTLILYPLYLIPGIKHFSMEPWLFYEKWYWRPRSGCYVCSLLLEWLCSLTFLLGGTRKICLYMLLSHFSHVWLCDPIDGSLPGFPIHGILQARILEWVAISSSNAWKWKVKMKSLSRVQLFATPWTAAFLAPPSWDFPGKSTGVGRHCLHCLAIKRDELLIHSTYVNLKMTLLSGRKKQNYMPHDSIYIKF